MNLIIDIGNTCVKLVCFDHNEVVEELRIDAGEEQRLDSFCHKYPFEKSILSSVVQVNDKFLVTLKGQSFPVLELKSGITPVPITNSYGTPYTLGTDRLAAVVGANYLSPNCDILVIDIGTCITYDFITAAGDYKGGNISLGPTMRLKALHHFTSKLPLVEKKGTYSMIGTSTETAIRSGVMIGIKNEIEGYVNAFAEKHSSLLVYLTGGVHLDLHFSEKMPIFANNYIVPIGLNRILEYNYELK